MISFLGDYFNWLAIPIMVNRLTGSAMMVGISVMATALPALIFGPLAGVFVDRWDRKWTMILADVFRALLVLPLLLVNRPDQVWMFYAVGFSVSCISQFFFPARGAVLPLVVTDKEDWLPANGLMQIIQTIGLIAGPALAGLAIGLWGEKVAFIANSTGYTASAIAVATMTVPRTTSNPPSGTNQLRTIWLDLKDGVVYLFSHRSTSGALICLTVVMLGYGAINVVWVPFLQNKFGIGATGLGIVDASQGAGMVVGGILLGYIAGRISKPILGAGGIALIGIGFGIMGFVPLFSLITVISFVIGIAIVPAQSALNTIMQLAVPDLKRGRVGSSFNAVTTAASLISMGTAALISEKIGLQNVYLLTGIIVLVGGLMGFWLLEEPEERSE